jgi:hypothetical protein
MAVYVSHLDDVVDPIEDLDEDGTTESLRTLMEELEGNVVELDALIGEFREYVSEAESRIREIGEILEARKNDESESATDAEDEPEEPVQAEAVGVTGAQAAG